MRVDAIALTGVEAMEPISLDLPEEEVGAILRIEACGVCGSDVEYYRKGKVDGVDASANPVILGHETVGVIEHIQPDSAARWGVGVGDRVVFERAIPCGHCEDCLSGGYQMCRRPGDSSGVYRYGSIPISIGHGLWGSFADHVVLHPDTVVYRASTAASAADLAFFTPLSNGLSWVTDSGMLKRGGAIAIQGPGQQGLACVAAARAAGADRIIVTGLAHDAARLEVARMMGATDTVVADADVGQQVLDLTAGHGVDVVIDTSSTESSAPIAHAWAMAAERGRIVTVNGHPRIDPEVPLDLERFWKRRLTMVGARSRNRWAVTAALSMLARRDIDMSLIPSRNISLAELPVAMALVAKADAETQKAIHTVVVAT